MGVHFHFHLHWPQSPYNSIIPSWEWPQTDCSMPWANLTKDTLIKYNKQKTLFLCKIFVNFGHILIRYGLYFYCCMLRPLLDHVCSALSLALHRYALAQLACARCARSKRSEKKGRGYKTCLPCGESLQTIGRTLSLLYWMVCIC